MALVIADRVKETTTTTSTGVYTLNGAKLGFQSFAAVGNGNTTYYVCTDGVDFEVGIGTFTASGTTLSRDTILESSNSDNPVDWSAGSRDVFVTVPAEKYLVRDASGNVSLTGNLSMGDNNKAIFGAGSDLQIYHDGSHSYISDQGEGRLRLAASDKIQFYNAAVTEKYAEFTASGAAELRYANAIKFATSSTGVDITGTLVSDGLTVDGTADVDNLVIDNAGKISSLGQIELQVDTDNNQSGTYIGFSRNNTTSERLALFSENGDISFYEDTGTTPKFFWDASAESLGIGTSSPASKMTIASDVNTETRTFLVDNAHSGGSMYNAFGVYVGGTDRMVTLSADYGDSLMAFRTNNAERMRLDASGNLLVGKTSTSSNVAGHRINPRGDIEATRSGGLVSYFNRQSSDGDISVFAKDGTTVGSIMSYFGDMVTGTGDVGIRWEDGGDLLTPWNPSTNLPRPSAIDLGATSVPFKDLYLSGGVYLGGTGAANKLDDYEEGTWTPSVQAGSISGTSITYTGYYRKVGSLVYIHFRASNSAGNINVSSYVTFSGLPFTLQTTSSGAVVTEDVDVFDRQGFAAMGGTTLTLSNCGSSSGTTDLYASLVGHTA